ncbi:hypothetical protein pb186bvf_010276 [Paramecium bursaria]
MYIRSCISQLKQLSEYQLAHNYQVKGLHNEAHDLYLQAIRILGNYENPRDLYMIAYKNSQYLVPQKQNEILIYGKQHLQTNLQYIKNLLYFDPQKALDDLKTQPTSQIQFENYLYYELFLIAKLVNSEKDTQQVQLNLKNSVEDQTQYRLMFSDCMNEWLSNTELQPLYLNNQLPNDISIRIFEQFQNTLTHLNQMPLRLADKFLKSFADFIINDNIQHADKTVVGQFAKQYLQYMETHKHDIYKPLFLLGWLNLRDNKKLAAEGLFRNIDEMIEKLPQSYESQLIKGQMSVQYMSLLKQFDKRQTEQQSNIFYQTLLKDLNNYCSNDVALFRLLRL